MKTNQLYRNNQVVFDGNIVVPDTVKSLKELTKLFRGYVPGCRIRGNFNCYQCNYLTTLEGGPGYVEENFSCGGKSLISLKCGPTVVEGSWACDDAPNLTSLEGMPLEIGDLFFDDCLNIKNPLYLFKVKVHGGFVTNNPQLKVVIKYYKSKNITECQNEMIRNGWKDYL